jgi:hypothetical protein
MVAGVWPGHVCVLASLFLRGLCGRWAWGHLGVLQWRSQEPPCPWDEQACTNAAVGGHLGMLQWLRAQEPPCPWDAGVVARTAFCHGHADIRSGQWLRARQTCRGSGRLCGARE